MTRILAKSWYENVMDKNPGIQEFDKTTIQKQPYRAVLRKKFLKICRIFTGEHLCQRVILLKLQNNFIEITFRHGCSPVN